MKVVHKVDPDEQWKSNFQAQFRPGRSLHVSGKLCLLDGDFASWESTKKASHDHCLELEECPPITNKRPVTCAVVGFKQTIDASQFSELTGQAVCVCALII